MKILTNIYRLLSINFLLCTVTAECTPPITIKNPEQAAISAALTIIGLIGTGLVYKYGKEMFINFKKMKALKNHIQEKNVKIKWWQEYDGFATIDHEKLIVPEQILANDLGAVQKDWQEYCSIRSTQNAVSFQLSWSCAAAILLLVAPAMLCKQIKIN